jgi:hypothetical protein
VTRFLNSLSVETRVDKSAHDAACTASSGGLRMQGLEFYESYRDCEAQKVEDVDFLLFGLFNSYLVLHDFVASPPTAAHDSLSRSPDQLSRCGAVTVTVIGLEMARVCSEQFHPDARGSGLYLSLVSA